MRARSVAILGAWILGTASPARADETGSGSDKAAAAMHFDEGVALMGKHEYPAACRKFRDSLEAYRGLGAMLWLADCYEKNGQTASAWTQFREAAAVAAERRDPREKVAREQIAALEPRLSYVTVRVPTATPGLVVRRDGVRIARASWDLPVPVDPGTHVVTATAPGHHPWREATSLTSGVRVESVVPPLEPIAVAATPAATPAPRRESSSPPARPESQVGQTQRITGVAVGAAGLVGLAVGGIFAVRIQSKLDESNANDHCRQPGDVCDAEGLAFREEAGEAATAATVATVVGGAALAIGALLFFTAPKPVRGGRGGAHGVSLAF